MKIRCSVAGITFRNKGPEFETVRPEGVVTFKHDPKNEYDPNAIEIWYGDLHIGYIKRDSYGQQFLKENPEVSEANITRYAYAEGTGHSLVFNDQHVGRLSALEFEIMHGEDDDVILDEDNNYVVGDVKHMRLSKVCAHFNPEPDNPGLDRWKIDHDSYEHYIQDLNERARAGTAMHDAIEQYIKYGQESDLIPEGFFNFIAKHKVEFIETESFIVDDCLGIAGRGDAGALATDGKKASTKKVKVWLDWKSSKKPTKKHALSTSWYCGEKGDYDEAWVVAFGAETKQGYSLMKVPNDKMVDLHAAVGHIKLAVDKING